MLFTKAFSRETDLRVTLSDLRLKKKETQNLKGDLYLTEKCLAELKCVSRCYELHYSRRDL